MPRHSSANLTQIPTPFPELLSLYLFIFFGPHMKNSSNSAHRRAPPPFAVHASASLKHEFQLLLVPHVEHAPNAKVTERRHCSLALVSTPLDASKCCIFLAAAAPFSLRFFFFFFQGCCNARPTKQCGNVKGTERKKSSHS